MSAFHFLRPEWLFALLPAAFVVALLWRAAGAGAARDWTGTVDAHLLRHLTVGTGAAARPSRPLLTALAGGLLAAVLALAGPAWEKLPTPTARGAEPVVAVVSLAQSMNGTDLVPSRLARAGHKLRDILDRAAGDDVGLVVYADRPFVAAPLTPDGNVIREMLPELSTGLMPVLGNRLDLAIGAAQNLLASAGATRGRILVMADDIGADPAATRATAEAARKAGYKVSVLGVGTPEGATLQTAGGQAISVNGAGPTVAKLDTAALQGLAQAGGGSYSEVTATNADIDRLLPVAQAGATRAGAATDIKADRWKDRGYLLALIPALLLPLAFRRGLIFALALTLLPLGLPGRATAAGLDGLWATPDQRGARAFAAGDYAGAATDFQAPDWRASALYRAGDYKAAAAAYGGTGFNAGNALAKAGDLEAALAAYDGWLADNPGDADAQFNRDLVAELLDQQQQQQSQQDQDQDGDQDQSGQSGQTGQQDPQSGQGQDQPSDQSQDQQSDQQHSGQQQAQSGGQPSNQPGEANRQPQDQGGSDAGQDQAAQDQAGQDRAAQDQASQQPGDQTASGDPDQTGAQDQGTAQAPAAPEASPDGNPQATGTEAEPKTADAGNAPGAAPQTASAQSPSAQTPGPQTAEAQPQTGTGTPGDQSTEDGGLSGLVDRLLAGNGTEDGTPETDAPAAAATGTPLSQSAEQQLRAVPDDPSGLLRARIAMHYARLRASGQ